MCGTSFVWSTFSEEETAALPHCSLMYFDPFSSSLFLTSKLHSLNGHCDASDERGIHFCFCCLVVVFFKYITLKNDNVLQGRLPPLRQ